MATMVAMDELVDEFDIVVVSSIAYDEIPEKEDTSIDWGDLLDRQVPIIIIIMPSC